MKNYKYPGETVQFAPAAATAAGTLVIINGMPGVALRTLAANELGDFKTTGVFEFPVTAATTAAVGAAAYATAAGVITTTSAGNTLVGRFWKACASTDSMCMVKIATP